MIPTLALFANLDFRPVFNTPIVRMLEARSTRVEDGGLGASEDGNFSRPLFPLVSAQMLTRIISSKAVVNKWVVGNSLLDITYRVARAN